MSAEPVELAQVGRYRYRHGWVLLEPRLATGRRNMRMRENAEIARAKPRPPRQAFNRKKALAAIRKAQGGRQNNASILAFPATGGVELAQRHHPIDPKIPLGSGGRFKKMKAKLAARGARDPGALAAYIGRRAYGPKKFAALGRHAHSNTGPALEFAMTLPRLPVMSPYDVLVVRGEGGSAVIRHRRGGYEIGRISRGEDGAWKASADGRDLSPHTRQRGALLELIGTHNRGSGTPYHRPEVIRAEPLQPPPVQTELMAAYGIPAVRALATPTRGSSDGPRATSGPEVAGLGQRGHTIYKKLRGRGFPHERAHAFARRAQNKAGGR